MGVTLHDSSLNLPFLISLSDPASASSIVQMNISKKSTLWLFRIPAIDDYNLKTNIHKVF